MDFGTDRRGSGADNGGSGSTGGGGVGGAGEGRLFDGSRGRVAIVEELTGEEVASGAGWREGEGGSRSGAVGSVGEIRDRELAQAGCLIEVKARKPVAGGLGVVDFSRTRPRGGGERERRRPGLCRPQHQRCCFSHIVPP